MLGSGGSKLEHRWQSGDGEQEEAGSLGHRYTCPGAIHTFLSCTLLHLGAHWEPTCPHRPPYAWVATQALMAFQRSLSVLLMLPVWQGMEAMSSK